MNDPRRQHLLSAHELLEDPPPSAVILDVRLNAQGRADRVAYLAGHLPGARFVDLDEDLSGAPGEAGLRPLPSEEVLQASIASWGIESDSPVIVYGDAGGSAPARAWWVLRWAGVRSVRLLDGGIKAWVDAGGVLTTELPGERVGSFRISTGAMPWVSADAIRQNWERTRLLDARPADVFARRESAPRSVLPGAVSAPVREDFDASGLLLPAPVLRERYLGLGVLQAAQGTVSYCTSGVAAALQVFVVATLGSTIPLFVGGLSEWNARKPGP